MYDMHVFLFLFIYPLIYSFINSFIHLFISERNYNWLLSNFSPGDFKSMGTLQSKKKDKQAMATPEEPQELAVKIPASVFACPQDGCVKVFQRLSSLEKHLSLEQCTKSLEKRTLLDLAKLGYKFRLEEGVGSISIPASAPVAKKSANVPIEEGWALKRTKKAYRFSEKQKSYLEAKFAIGQSTGKKLDGEVVAREMRRALGTDGVRLFKSSEFLTAMQISSYFSRLAANARQQISDDSDVQACNEEEYFATTRESALAIALQHPITYDQYDICAMAKDGSLERLKLGMLQNICQKLELEVPVNPIRRKRVYLDLINEAVASCTCEIRG